MQSYIFFVVAGSDVPYAGCPLVYTWMFFSWCLPAYFLVHRDGELGSRLLPPFAKRLLGLFEFAVLWTKWSKECLKSARPIYISQWQKWLWVLVFFCQIHQHNPNHYGPRHCHFILDFVLWTKSSEKCLKNRLVQFTFHNDKSNC